MIMRLLLAALAVCTLQFGTAASASEITNQNTDVDVVGTTDTSNPRVGVGPVHLTEEDCGRDERVYTPSQTAIRIAEQSGRRQGLVRAFPNASDTETICMLMNTSVRVGPGGATKAPDGVRVGDFWVRGYSRYVTRRNGRGAYIYELCINDISRLAQPTEVAAQSVILPQANLVVATSQTQTRTVTQEQVVQIQPVIRYVYLPARVEGALPGEVSVAIPPPLYRQVVQEVAVPVQQPQKRCICHWPANDPSVTVLYRYPRLDRNGQAHCVPLYMIEQGILPPGFVQ
jgi:hypothetical protein